MKYLLVVRHAKSSWRHHDVDDINRPLNQRGYIEADLLAKRIKSSRIKYDLLISSPAVRAYTTALILNTVSNCFPSSLQLENALYPGYEKQLINRLSKLPGSCSKVALVAHNEFVSDFISSLLHTSVDRLKTSEAVLLSFKINSWSKMSDIPAQLVRRYQVKWSSLDNYSK
jgi:phosphohistidine phosphatase